MHLRHEQLELVGVVCDQIPGIGAELVLDVIEERGRPVEMDAPVPPQGDPEEVIETDEMVHVGVGNEDVVDLQEFTRRQEMEVAEIEKERLVPVLEIHVDPGITEGIIDQRSAVDHVLFLPCR